MDLIKGFIPIRIFRLIVPPVRKWTTLNNVSVDDQTEFYALILIIISVAYRFQHMPNQVLF